MLKTVFKFKKVVIEKRYTFNGIFNYFPVYMLAYSEEK